MLELDAVQVEFQEIEHRIRHTNLREARTVGKRWNLEAGQWWCCYVFGGILSSSQIRTQMKRTIPEESFPIRCHFPCYPASSQNWTFFPTQSKTNPGWMYWTKPLWIHTVGAVGCAQSWTDDWFVKPHIHCTLRWPLQMPFWSSCISQGPQGFKCRSSWFELIRVVKDFSLLEGFMILKSDLYLNNQTARWT